MEIKFNEDKNAVEIVFENPQQNILFDLNKEVKLTDFVKFISNLEYKISISPESYDDFVGGKEPPNKEAYKLIEYIYKIAISINLSNVICRRLIALYIFFFSL